MRYWDTLRRMNNDYLPVVDKAGAVRLENYGSTGSWEGTAQDSIGSGAKTLLPWPSLGWQRAALGVAVVLGLVVAIAGVKAMNGPGGPVGGLEYLLGGSALTAMAAYAGWATRWLTRTWLAPLAARIAGGVAIGLVVAMAIFVYILLGALLMLAPMAMVGAVGGCD